MGNIKDIRLMMGIIFALFASCSATKIFAQTQQLKFNKIDGSNVISLGKINAITQDNLGFMWFSDQSNGAIIRYDGSYFKQYKHDPQNSGSLGGSYPECLFASDSGIIWIGFYGQGLDRFDPRTNTFTHYRHDPQDPNSLSTDMVSAVLVDHLGNVWVGTDEGLDLLEPETGNFLHFRYKENDFASLSHNIVRSLYEDRSGTLWVGTGFAFDPDTEEGGLNRFDRNTGSFQRYVHDPKNPRSLISNKVRAILEDSHGNFWVGTDGDGLHSMDRETGEFTRYTHDPNQPGKLSRPALNGTFDHITFLVEDKAGKIWMGLEDAGLCKFDPITHSVTQYGNETRDFKFLVYNEDWNSFTKGNSAWCAYVTDDGLLWMSTQRFSNFFKIDLYNNHIPSYPDDAINGGVRSFVEESTSVFWKATTFNGLVREDLEKGTSKRYVHDPENAKSISDNKLNSIIKDHLGQLWIGTDFGLNKFDPLSETFTHYLPDSDAPESISDGYVNVVYEDSKFNLWLGTQGGLNLMNQKTGSFLHYSNIPTDQTSLSGNAVTTLVEDNQGSLWIGVIHSGAGINRFDPITQTFKRYLQGLSVISLLVDDGNVLWAGTAGGLYRYDPDTDRFENTNITANITEVINDLDDNLWLYTTDGIIRYDQQNGSTIQYGEENGVQGIKELAMFGHPYRKSDGTIFFGGWDLTEGYYAFHPDKLWISGDASHLYFTDFLINGESALIGNGINPGEFVKGSSDISLKHYQNVFAIQFTGIDYRNPGSNRLFYMLENYDPDWLSTNGERPASYFKVPPGEYIFRIKAQNSSNGIWSEKNINLTISPPWWTTWRAYTIYGIFFIAGVFFIDRFQRKRLLKKAQEKAKEKELAQAKEIEKAYTSLKATQSQLIQSEKMASLGELTAGIAHEIQNPLNFVNNFSEVNKELLVEMNEEIQKGNFDEVKTLAKDVTDNEEKITFHGKRADAIVKGMLQHSRSSSGKKEPTDINALADEYLRLAYHGLRARDKSFNAKLETTFEEGIGNVNVIPQDIGRVILNLITNAFYAVNEKSTSANLSKEASAKLEASGDARAEDKNYEPKVKVSTKKEGDKVIISVQDNGKGIPDSVKKKIFEPFFTTKPTGQGTGLGLSMSYDIVTKGHGGVLKVTSKVGEGTTFTVVLPAINENKKPKK